MQEQNLPTPISPENPQTRSPSGAESLTPPVPEVITPSQERVDRRGDAANQNAQASTVQPLNLPQPLQSATTDSSNENLAVDAPAVADDVDVIEKVWVDKAKSIIKETRDDPHLQEIKVSGLQTEYQKKRYGSEDKE